MKTLLMSLLIILVSQGALAEKLDLETHNQLIQKLESVVSLDSPEAAKDSMVAQAPLAHRLADLYAERARLLSMENEGQGDKTHAVEIKSDRSKAITLSQRILSSLSKEDKGPVLMQMAHLHELLNQSPRAEAIYLSIEKNSQAYDPRSLALAEIELGEISFLRGQWSQAQAHFERANKNPANPRQGYTQFRLAWVHFNFGQTILAEKELTAILKNRQLLQNTKGEIDQSFQDEASHDLATFMAHNDIHSQSIAILSAVTPDASRKKNLIYLATELDRQARKKSALMVWNVIGKQELSFEDQLDRQIQIARIEYDLGHHGQLITEISAAISLLSSKNCLKNPDCTVANQNLRRIITDWGKAEERVPSPELVKAYAIYTAANEDEEMSYWAGQTALKLKQYPQAFAFYKNTASILAKNSQQTQRRFEGSLLNSIEAAELSGNKDLQLQSYQLYLSLNPQGAKRSEVRYQIAHSYYDKNNFSQAINEFHILALDSTMDMDLRIKSADLCLDSDVILKNESQVEAHSLEFSHLFKSKSADYLVIWRKSLINQAALVINDDKSSEDLLQKQLRKLQAISLIAWPANQKKQIIKDKIAISFKLKDLESLAQSSQDLLALSKTTAEEKGLALHHLAWISEVRMDFAQTLAWMRKIKPTADEQSAYYFKMALLKELLNQNPTAEYNQFMKVSHSVSQRQYAAHQLVIHSSNPRRDFKKFESVLMANQRLYTSSGVFVFERTGDEALSRRLLSRSSVKNSLEGLLLAHPTHFQAIKATEFQMVQNRLVMASDAKLKKSLNKRIQLLKGLEKKANQAIASKDTSLQLLYLTAVANGHLRLSQEITALPMPRGLKAEQKKLYQAQVQELVKPYLLQAKAITEKTLDLWEQAMDQKSFQELYDLSVQKDQPGSRLAAREIDVLRASAQRVGLGEDPFGKLSSQRQKMANEAESLQRQIRRNPFRFDDLEKMKSLQSTLGGGPMVAYLESRLNERKTRGAQ